MGVNLKKQDWTEFDEFFNDISTEHFKKADVQHIKKSFAKPNEITDGQRKMIIAVLTNELDWDHAHSFNFILKQIPGLSKRISPETKENHDLSKLYNKITKPEASKLIDALKSISTRMRNKVV